MKPLQSNIQDLPVDTEEVTNIFLVANFRADIQAWDYRNANKVLTNAP
jgi:hypothetical protein